MTTSPVFPLESRWAVKQAFDDYATRCERTLIEIFERPGSDAVDMRGWMYDSAPDTDIEAMADMMHIEPLHLVAEFLGIDESSDAFQVRVKDYSDLAEREGWHRR
jgi:hypothetical protein